MFIIPIIALCILNFSLILLLYFVFHSFHFITHFVFHYHANSEGHFTFLFSLIIINIGYLQIQDMFNGKLYKYLSLHSFTYSFTSSFIQISEPIINWLIKSRLIKLRAVSYIGEGQGNPLQYSCLENPMDRGAWWAAVHGVTKSWTQLKQLSIA